MYFFATVLTVALATLLMSSGAAVAPGYRMGSCSFGYNNVYYMFGGAVCTPSVRRISAFLLTFFYYSYPSTTPFL